MQKVPQSVINAIKTNPEAAKKFNDYFHEVEPKILAAQRKFADEMNKYVQEALKNFIDGEKAQLSPEDIKTMETEAASICKKLSESGNKTVKDEFKKMSLGVKSSF